MRHKFTRSVTLERVSYGIALKTAVRLGGAFKASDGRQSVIVLRLPKAADIDEYGVAADILFSDIEALQRFKIVVPKPDRRGRMDLGPYYVSLRTSPAVAVLWPSTHELPNELELHADRVVDVPPVRPSHLVAAAKVVSGQIIAPEDAEKMLVYPPSTVFAAFRPGRSPEETLKKLAQSASPKPSRGPRLESLVGYGEARDWGMSLAEDIRDWKSGRLPWSDVDHGILLSGPPGTGKTMFAGALARQCGIDIVATSVARWQSAGYLSDTLKAVRDVFADAVRKAPCILFIDEIDAIGDRATMANDQNRLYWTQVLNLLLEFVDGHAKQTGVVIVGATNHPQHIDPALRRSGRLDKHVVISPPNLEDRRHLARLYFGQHLPDDALQEIALATAGFTGADFERAGRDAKRQARRMGELVSLEIAMGCLPPASRLEGRRRKIVSVHEAAHAVVGVHLGVGKLEAVVVPFETRGDQPAGFAQFTPLDDREPDRRYHQDSIAVLLAGRAAEEEFLGTAYAGAGGVEGSDLQQATDVATLMEAALGMGEGLSYHPTGTSALRDVLRRSDRAIAARVERALAREMARCREIVRDKREVIAKVAAELETRGHIESSEIAIIMRRHQSGQGRELP